MARGSSIYEIPVIVNVADPIPINTKILASDVSFVAGEFNPGKGATLRVILGLAPGADFEVSITLDGSTPSLKLNGDNSFVVKSGGYNRFDVGVDETTLFNFSINQSLAQAGITHIKLQKIVFGA